MAFSSRWCDDARRAKRWQIALQRAGPEAVRLRLAGEDGRSTSAISGIGSDLITRGFIEDWLVYIDIRRTSRRAKNRAWLVMLGFVLVVTLGGLWFARFL